SGDDKSGGGQVAARACLVCDQAVAASILNHLHHQVTIDTCLAIGVTVNECALAMLIDEARNSTAVLVGQHDGGVRKQVHVPAGHAQPVMDVMAGLIRPQSAR